MTWSELFQIQKGQKLVTLARSCQSFSCFRSSFKLRVHYLQRSYPSEYKRYSPIAFIIISIEDSSSMPDPAPQPQEQPPQVPRTPQDAVVQNIVASATPAGDTPTTPDQLEVHVVLPFSLSFILFCFARVRIGCRARYPRGLLSASFLPLLVLWYSIRLLHFIPYF